MKNYQELLTAMAGCRRNRLLRALFTAYQLADFCNGPYDLPPPVGGDFRKQIEVLFPGQPSPAGVESAGIGGKNHACLYAHYRGCGPAYSPERYR
ncbi:MAG: hypothetical protein V2I26_18035 [Halieaceae bacterium]|jgi:hypothetical protein|nr:hypothetical protein [Halieaceae bacterium]